MSQQPPTTAAAPDAATGGESVDVLVPGRTHPLHVALTRSCGETTVRELRAAALDQLHREDPRSTAQYVRLIFRGKELQDPEATLSSHAVQSGSALHGMVTSVQPHSQQAESEAAAMRRTAQQALASAVGSLLGDATTANDAANPAALTAGARAQMSQGELMRLLHEETMLRRAAAGQPPRPQPANSGGNDPNEVAIPITGPSAPAQPGEEEEVQTVDGGRVRVTTLADGSARQQRQQRREAAQQAATAEEQQEAANTMGELARYKWSCAVALLAGFFLGPVAFFIPFERMEVNCIVIGFGLNILCNFMW